MAKVLGIGGIFFKCNNPKDLANWYKTWLDFPLDSDFSASFYPSRIPQGAYTVWGAFNADTDYFKPSKQEYMINLMVDDLEGVLKRVQEGGAKTFGKIESNEYGQFAWIIDPQGNKVELWEPNIDQI